MMLEHNSVEYPDAAESRPQQTIIIQQAETKQGNGIGVAGFVLALLGLLLGWVPILCFILWILGLVFSFVGLYKRPKGFAIAGLCISFIYFIIMVSIAGLLAAAFGFLR